MPTPTSFPLVLKSPLLVSNFSATPHVLLEVRGKHLAAGTAIFMGLPVEVHPCRKIRVLWFVLDLGVDLRACSLVETTAALEVGLRFRTSGCSTVSGWGVVFSFSLVL